MQIAASRPRHSKSGLLARRANRWGTAKPFLLAAALLLFAVSAGNAFAQDEDPLFQDFHFTGTLGSDYSNGNYGTSRNTDVELGLATLSVETGGLEFSAGMPYMRISGRGLVVFDAAGNPIVINRRTALPPDVRTGFGDLSLSSTYNIPPAILDDFEVKLTGGIKLPTASERQRLSTGKTDYSMSIDVSRSFGAWDPFLTVGYLIAGQPDTFQLYNTVSVSAGTSLELSDNLVAVASYDFDSASTPLVPASHELFGSLSWICDDSITLTGYSTAGLSSGSPNIGAGLLISYSFN